MISITATTPCSDTMRPVTSPGASLERGTGLPWSTSAGGRRGAAIAGYVPTFATEQAFAVGVHAWSPPV